MHETFKLGVVRANFIRRQDSDDNLPCNYQLQEQLSSIVQSLARLRRRWRVELRTSVPLVAVAPPPPPDGIKP